MKLVKPKKFLGQHFLKDLQVAQDIADTVDACPTLPVLEVGPGMGVLTQYLLKKDRPLKVVELDFESVAYLRENFPQLGDHIIEQDFLKMDLRQLFDGQPFVLTGNYPYNISSQIFFKMLEHDKELDFLLHGHDSEGSGRTHRGSSGQQDLRHSEHTDSSLVQRGIPVHRTRTCVQSSSQGEERRHPHDPQRDQGVGMQREIVQADCQDDIQPASQDAPQLHFSDSGEGKSTQCRPYLQQTA